MTAVENRFSPHSITKIAAVYLAVAAVVVAAVAWAPAPSWGVPLVAGVLFFALPFALVLVWALRGPKPAKPERGR